MPVQTLLDATCAAQHSQSISAANKHITENETDHEITTFIASLFFWGELPSLELGNKAPVLDGLRRLCFLDIGGIRSARRHIDSRRAVEESMWLQRRKQAYIQLRSWSNDRTWRFPLWNRNYRRGILKGSNCGTMSMKPMRSTGMTGQSSSLGMWVSPNTYLQMQNFSCKDHELQTEETMLNISVQGERVPEDDVSFLQGSILLHPSS